MDFEPACHVSELGGLPQGPKQPNLPTLFCFSVPIEEWDFWNDHLPNFQRFFRYQVATSKRRARGRSTGGKHGKHGVGLVFFRGELTCLKTWSCTFTTTDWLWNWKEGGGSCMSYVEFFTSAKWMRFSDISFRRHGATLFVYLKRW